MKILNYLFIGYALLFLLLMTLTLTGNHLDLLSEQQGEKVGTVAMSMLIGFIIVGGLQVLGATFSLITTKSKKWIVYFTLLTLFSISFLGLQIDIIPRSKEYIITILPCICYITYIVTVFKVHKK